MSEERGKHPRSETEQLSLEPETKAPDFTLLTLIPIWASSIAILRSTFTTTAFARPFMNGACNGVSGTPKLFINNERCGTAEEPTTPLEKPSLTPQ